MWRNKMAGSEYFNIDPLGLPAFAAWVVNDFIEQDEVSNTDSYSFCKTYLSRD